VGGLFGVGEGDFVHEVCLPETVRMAAFIEPAYWWRRRWWGRMERLVSFALETLDGGGADCQLFVVLQVPHEALRAKVRPQLEEILETLLGQPWHPACRSRGWRALRKPRKAVACTEALNRACTRSFRPQLLLYLIGTMRRMALAERNNSLFAVSIEAIMRMLWPTPLIRKRLAHGIEGAPPEFVEITAGEAVPARDAGGFLSSEERQHRLYTAWRCRPDRRGWIGHRKCPTSWSKIGYTRFAEHLKSAMAAGL
jgi:hypothetical protein